DYSPAGQNSWTAQVSFADGSGGYSAQLPASLRGLYDYQLHYLRIVDGGGEFGFSTQVMASSSGQFSFDGTTMQIVGPQVDAQIPISYFDSVAKPVKELYWLAVPGADSLLQ